MSLVLVCLLLAAGWGVWQLSGRSGYFVRIAGQDASFKTEAELHAIAEQQAAKVKIVFGDSQQREAPELTDIGVSFDIDATVQQAKNIRMENWRWIQPWRPAEVPLAITVDDTVLRQFLEVEFAGVYRAPVQPSLQFNERLKAYEVVPGRSGTGFDAAALAHQLKTVTNAPRPLTFQASTTTVPPTVSDFVASKVAEAARFRIQLRLNFLYQDKLVYFPEPAEIADWQQVRVSRDGATLELTYDRTKITAFLEGSVSASLNDLFGSEGTEIKSRQPLVLAEVGALVGDIVLALQSAQPLEKELLVQPGGGAE